MVSNLTQEELAALLNRLTPDQQREVIDFARFLAQRTVTAPEATQAIRFEGWAGCLAHVDMSAVELQHETTRLWASN